MTALAWKEEYRINVAVIDDQHRTLADMVAKLHQALASPAPAKDLRAILQDLIEFTRLHFATEEELMVKHAYPDYQAHRQEHTAVLTQMHALADTLTDEVRVRFDPEKDLADDWVTKHLLASDVPLGKFLNEKGVF